MFGVMLRESHCDHRTAFVNQILHGLVLAAKQRCDLEQPVGLGAGMHKPKKDVLQTGEG
jgi:hypothetical protein